MGFSSIWHWLIVLLVVVLLFGTKKLRNVGGDLGAAIRNFKQGLNEGKEGLNGEADEPAKLPRNESGTSAEQDAQKSRDAH